MTEVKMGDRVGIRGSKESGEVVWVSEIVRDRVWVEVGDEWRCVMLADVVRSLSANV